MDEKRWAPRAYRIQLCLFLTDLPITPQVPQQVPDRLGQVLFDALTKEAPHSKL